MLDEMLTKTDAIDAAHSAVEKANDADCFLTATWTVKDGRIRLAQRVSWNFPYGDVASALKLLAANMQEEANSAPPLPVADLDALNADLPRGY